MSTPDPKRAVRIRLPHGSQSAAGTTVSFLDGEELPHVFSVTIKPLEPGSIVTAFIEMPVDAIDIEAIPFLGLESLHRAAIMQGYQLVKMDEEESDE